MNRMQGNKSPLYAYVLPSILFILFILFIVFMARRRGGGLLGNSIILSSGVGRGGDSFGGGGGFSGGGGLSGGGGASGSW